MSEETDRIRWDNFKAEWCHTCANREYCDGIPIIKDCMGRYDIGGIDTKYCLDWRQKKENR